MGIVIECYLHNYSYQTIQIKKKDAKWDYLIF